MIDNNDESLATTDKIETDTQTATNHEKDQGQKSNNPSSDVNQLDHPRYEELTTKLTAAEQLANKYWNDYLRAQADFENFQRRTERDIANAHKYAVEKIAFELLAIIDNLERCLENKVNLTNTSATSINLDSIYTGVELTLKMFLEVLQKFEIRQLNPLGENFNHEYHTAMMMKEDPSTKPNTILQVVQKGYLLKDRLLRPALVVVAKNQ